MKATILKAMQIMRIITPIAHRHGFLASVYGSVMIDGVGRDIDLLLIPWRTSYSIEQCLEDVRQAFGAVQRSPYKGLMCSYSVSLETSDGIFLDLQFREQTIREMEYRPA